jgi:hypothetical protein
MRKPEIIDYYDFSDRIQVPDGYDMTSIPDLTRDNFQYLVDEYNNLAEAFNAMADFNGFNDFVNYDK